MRPAQTHSVTPEDLGAAVATWVREPGRRFGHMTARVENGRTRLEVLGLDTGSGSTCVFTALLEEGRHEYPAVTRHVAAAHRAERVLGDFFGVRASGHPRWKSAVLHEGAWPTDLFPLAHEPGVEREPYRFMEVRGEGIHEIPVGPIHAGVIEPGHFRFSCVGEIVAYLEIRLGYQHRGVEKRLVETPWHRMRFLAESAASDTAIGNALAHATAVEGLIGIEAPPRAQQLRTIALELERVSCHVGDLGGLAADVGYSAGASLFAPLRGAVLSLCEILSGNRLQRYYVRPGGVSRDLSEEGLEAIRRGIDRVRERFEELSPLLLENPGFIDRAEGTGRLAAAHCRDYGLVGPAARASGSEYDARNAFKHGLFPELAPPIGTRSTGDVFARAQIRADEAAASLALIRKLLSTLEGGDVLCLCEDAKLPANAVGVGIVEAWRGELIHWLTTGSDGGVERYAIRDPSMNNWTGLSLAVRNNLVPDFPLCNKSFSLSYSGNDL